MGWTRRPSATVATAIAAPRGPDPRDHVIAVRAASHCSKFRSAAARGRIRGEEKGQAMKTRGIRIAVILVMIAAIAGIVGGGVSANAQEAHNTVVVHKVVSGPVADGEKF